MRFVQPASPVNLHGHDVVRVEQGLDGPRNLREIVLQVVSDEHRRVRRQAAGHDRQPTLMVAGLAMRPFTVIADGPKLLKLPPQN